MISLAIASVSTSLARAQFTPGHVFVAVTYGEGCFDGEFEGILEIDPASGEVSVFADSDDGMCFPSGLAFTPDGTQLLSLDFGLYFEDLGWVQAFAPDGSSEVMLDGGDGMANPSGSNGIAYDRQGNLYVVTGDNWYIMRYTPEGTSEVFADAEDGVVFQGAIAVAPNGDVFFCSHRTHEVVRITPDGIGTLFDIPPQNPRSMVIDRQGNLYVGCSATNIYRYEGAIAANRQLLSSGYAFSLGALTLSADETQLYVITIPLQGTNGTELFEIQIQNGASALLAGWAVGFPKGIALHINYLADLDGDRDIDLQDLGALSNCLEDMDCLRADINHDGHVNTADLAILIGAMTGRGWH